MIFRVTGESKRRLTMGDGETVLTVTMGRIRTCCLDSGKLLEYIAASVNDDPADISMPAPQALHYIFRWFIAALTVRKCLFCGASMDIREDGTINVPDLAREQVN
jgi:hypothetical protein